MSRRYQRSTRKSKFRLPWWSVILGLCFLWILASMYFQKSPSHLITDGIRYFKGEPAIYPTPQELSQDRKMLVDSIDALNVKITDLQNHSPYRKALVNTEAKSLNMRAEANLASAVVVKIPDSSTVEVLYFDENVLVLDGEAGKWCKVKYADKEGWVWSNYVKLID